MDCCQTIIKEEGFKGLYKGVQSPIIGMAALNSVLFLSYGQSKSWMQKDADDPLTIKQLFVCGTIVGFTVAFVEGPVDFFKSQLQVQYGSGTPKYSGFLDCARQIVKSRGIRGVYQGLSATLLRDIPANAMYFGSYEVVRRSFVKPGQSVSDLSAVKVMVAGGIGGMMYWISTFPFDVVKSTMQTDSTDPEKRKYKGLTDTFQKLYKSEGFKGFWKGIVPCMLRSFPANAVCFLLYEMTRKATG